MKQLVAMFIAFSVILASPVVMAADANRAGASSKADKAKVVKKSKKPVAKAKAKKKIVAKAKSKKPVAKIPAMAINYDDAFVDGELNLRSSSVLVVNQKTGEALYAKNAEVATPIASITKLMTALVTLDADLALEEPITIGREDVDRLKHTSSRLPLGATLTRGELLNLALIASENRAAAALSRSYPAGRPAFIMAMNRKARTLGMHNTYFVDGTGLSSENRSTAADLVKLVDASYQYPQVRDITSTGSFDVQVPGRRIVRVKENGKIKRVSRPIERHIAYVNTNALTRNENWEIGISKTGYINEAGHCLVMQTRIAGEKVIIVLLDSWGKMSRIGDANRVRRWLENGAAGKFAAHVNGGPV